jgi:preprotein translocase subunit SecE
MMKRDEIDINEFIEKKLDQISAMGEWVGKYLGSFGRTTQKIIIGSVILVVFGIVAFIWAVAKGMSKKK